MNEVCLIMRLEVRVGEGVSSETVAKLVRRLIEIGQEDAAQTLENGEGDMEAATLARGLQIGEPVVASVIIAPKRKAAEKAWKVVLTMENKAVYEWQGQSDDRPHAEGLAIAEAIEKTGEQVYEINSVEEMPAGSI